MIVEFRKVTSYRVLSNSAQVWYDQEIPQGDQLQSFIPRYELSLSCGVLNDTIGCYRKVTSDRALSRVTT